MPFQPQQLKAMATVAAIADYYQKEFLASKGANSAAALLGLQPNEKKGWLSTVKELADGVGKLYNSQSDEEAINNQNFTLWINHVDRLRTDIRNSKHLLRRRNNSRLATALEAAIARIDPVRCNGNVYLPDSPADRGKIDEQDDPNKNPLLKLVNFMCPPAGASEPAHRQRVNDEDYIQRHLIKRIEKPVRNYTNLDNAREVKIFSLVNTSCFKKKALRKINLGLNEFYESTVEARNAKVAASGPGSTFLGYLRDIAGKATRKSGEHYQPFAKCEFGKMLSSIDSTVKKITSFSFGVPEGASLLSGLPWG